MNTRTGTCNPGLRRTTLTIVMTRESVVNSLLLAYAFLTPLLVIPVAGLLGASDLLFIPAIAATVLVGRLRKCVTSHFLLAAFLILVGVSLYQTDDLSYVLKWGRLIGISFPFFLACFSTLTLRQVIRVFFWSGLFAILTGIVLWWFDIALFAEEANQRIWLDNGESRIRAAGVFGNSTGFGALIAMWTVTCGMQTISEERPDKRILAAILLTSIVGLACSTSRVSLAAIVAGMGAGASFMFAAHLKRRGFRLRGSTISLAILVLVVTLGTLCLIIPQLMEQEWLQVTYSRFDPRAHHSSNSFLAGRVAIWREYLASIDQWGVLGVGYKQGYLHFSSSPHNQFLSLAAECGFLCLCMFIVFVANIVWNSFAYRMEKPFEAMMCLAVIATFIADSMGGEPLGSWQITPVTMILLGICVSRFANRTVADGGRTGLESSRAAS